MVEILMEYGLFLLKTITIVAAVIGPPPSDRLAVLPQS